jgi:signal transduction histidine kinase
MTGLVILTFIPAVAAVFFLIRMRAEQKARSAAERRLRAVQRQDRPVDHAEWNAVLGHELRSPAAAILGYQELLEEGTFGELPSAAGDAMRRIRLAADQLLFLVDSVERSSAPLDDIEDAAPIAARDLIADAVSAVAFEAESRDTRIDIATTDLTLVTRGSEARRALALVLGAAIKVSAGMSINVTVSDGSGTPTITISGTRLHPSSDAVTEGVSLSGAGLRLELARAAAALAEGSLELDADGTVRIALPRLQVATPHYRYAVCCHCVARVAWLIMPHQGRYWGWRGWWG